MGTISPSQAADGTTGVNAASINGPINTIANEFNGNIDNANIKSGAAIATAKLASDAGIVTAMVADSAVTPAKVLAGTGSTWAWQTWTPTLVNLSGGTQTYAKYIQTGKTVFFRFRYTMAGANISGSVTFTLPVTANSAYGAEDHIPGTTVYVDNGNNNYLGGMVFTSTTIAKFYGINAAGTIATSSTALSSTVPFTWGAADYITCSGFYEAA